MRHDQPPDRYEAAIRLERAYQQIRETSRNGFEVTRAQMAEVQDAEQEYDAATADAI